MRKIILIAMMLMATMQLKAADVDLTRAQELAYRFLQNSNAALRLSNVPTTDLRLLHTEVNSVRTTQPVYYIFNSNKGFVIVAGDDRAQAILAYGDAPLASMDQLPNNMSFWLGYYKAQVELLQSRPGMQVEKPRLNATSETSVSPLITCSWDQGYPYYAQCPMDGDRRALTGCAATSLAQVFYKWQYPTEPTPVVPGYQTTTRGFQLPELPSVTFDWENMLDAYSIGSYDNTNKDAVAQLMAYIGQAEHMDYTNEGSEAWEDDIVRACEMFGYEDAHVTYKSVMNFDTGVETQYINDDDWSALLQSELVAGRPMVFCAYDYNAGYNSYGGHAFNVDGYNATDGTFHINWGWSGKGNGYFALNAFKYSGATYHLGQLVVMNIQPSTAVAPTIKVNPEVVALEASVGGEPATATFTVKGRLLTGDITLTLNDANGVFALDADVVTMEQAGDGKAITVSYAPQAVGTHTATVTVSSPGAEDKTIALNGTAKPAPLVLVDPVMLPADSSWASATSFRADWTDETASQNVVSYTLEVTTKPNYVLLDEAQWGSVSESFFDQTDNASAYFPAGWTFSGSGLWAEDGYISISGTGAFSTPTYDMADAGKVTVVMTAKSGYPSASFTVSTSAGSQQLDLTDRTFQQYVVVLDCATADNVTIANKSGNPGFLSIQIYAGEVEAPQLRGVAETGDATYRLITGITDKFYTVSDLTALGSFLYKVKATYVDGTESAWSNVEQVTLFDNGSAVHDHKLGDANHDGAVDVSDVTMTISSILGYGDVTCPICADAVADNTIDVADVTAIISIILNNQ